MKISELLNEGRQTDLKYTEKRIKEVLDRVTVELEGNQSGVMSKLTTRYSRLDKSAKLLAARREELNEKMKESAEALFDATDAVLTRVVDTVSYTITLSKAEKAADKKPKSSTDFEAIVKELSEMVPELEEKIKVLTKKYTELIPAKDTPVALRVKSKLEEGIVDTVKGWAKAFLAEIKSWGAGYDKRLAALKKQLQGTPLKEAEEPAADDYSEGFFCLGFWGNPYNRDKEYFWSGPFIDRADALNYGKLKQARGQPRRFTNWVKGTNKVVKGVDAFVAAAEKVGMKPNVTNLEWK